MKELLQAVLITLAIILPIFLISNGFQLPNPTNEEAPTDMDMSHTMDSAEPTPTENMGGHDMESMPGMNH